MGCGLWAVDMPAGTEQAPAISDEQIHHDWRSRASLTYSGSLGCVEGGASHVGLIGWGWDVGVFATARVWC